MLLQGQADAYEAGQKARQCACSKNSPSEEAALLFRALSPEVQLVQNKTISFPSFCFLFDRDRREIGGLRLNGDARNTTGTILFSRKTFTLAVIRCIFHACDIQGVDVIRGTTKK